MTRSFVPLGLIALLASACAATSQPSAPPEPPRAAATTEPESAPATSSTRQETVAAAQPVDTAAPAATEAPAATKASAAGAQPVDAAAPREAAAPARPAGEPRSAAELELWNDPAFRRQLAESYMAETDIEPRVTQVEREAMQEVLDQIAAGKLDKARALVAKQVSDSSSAVFDFTLANIEFQQEHLDQAAAAYRTAVDKFPKFRRAWRNLGMILVRQADFDAALPVLTRVVELGGGDGITYGLLGFCCSNLGNPVSAESAYRMAVLLDPETLDWRMGLARSFFEEERYDDAVALCNSLIQEFPDRADLWMLQANAYIGLKRPLDAAKNLELVDDMGHSTPESLQMLGDIYVNEELFDLAVDCYGRAMEMAPDARPARALVAAKVLAGRGELDRTRELVDRIEAVHGEDLSPEDRKDLLKLRARIAVAAGAGEEEAHVLEQIVELDPLDGEALILLGQHSAKAGDVEQAIFYYERAESLEKYEADAKVRHAQLLVGQSRYAEALPLLRRAQQLEPRDNVQEYLEQVERIAQGR